MSFATFEEMGNGAAVAHLRQVVRHGSDLLTLLWGGPATGKSHLLQAACRAAGEHGKSASYLPLRDEGGALVAALVDSDALPALLCVDDLDAVTGDHAMELGLFALLNRMRDAGLAVIASASRPPTALGVQLADLASRLGWGPCFEILPLSDEGRLAVLRQQAETRGIELSAEAGRYLLVRVDRHLGRLLELLDRLDRAALSEQRRLTVPFLREFLARDDG